MTAALFALGAILLAANVVLKRADDRACRFANVTAGEDER